MTFRQRPGGREGVTALRRYLGKACQAEGTSGRAPRLAWHARRRARRSEWLGGKAESGRSWGQRASGEGRGHKSSRALWILVRSLAFTLSDTGSHWPVRNNIIWLTVYEDHTPCVENAHGGSRQGWWSLDTWWPVGDHGQRRLEQVQQWGS